MACHQCSVDLHAAQYLPYRGIGLEGSAPVATPGVMGTRHFCIDDDRFPLVAGQGFCQDAGKHTFPRSPGCPRRGDPSFPLSSTVDISDTPQMFWPAFTGYAIRERNFEHAAFFLWKHAAYGIYISVPAEYLVSNL